MITWEMIDADIHPRTIELRARHETTATGWNYRTQPSGRQCTDIADGNQLDWFNLKFAQTIRDLMLAGFCIVCMAGCGLTKPVGPDAPKPDAPVVVERATAEDIFTAIAHSAEADLKAGFAPQLLEVAELVKRLCDNGELTSADAVKFDAAFPGAVRSEVRLTAEDIAKLKGLK